MIRLSIIGLGAIGERLLPIFKDYKEIEIASVYDINEETTKYICDNYDVKAASSVDEILNDASIDSVYLAVPPKFHRDLAIEIIKSGKHILCEKPLAGTIQEAREMMEYVKGKDLVNAMNFPVYFGPAYKKLKEILDKKSIGRIKRIEIRGIFPDWPRFWQVNPWIDTKDQGGFVREVFTHFIQIVQDYFGLIELDDSHVLYPIIPNKSETDVFARGHIGNIPVVFNGMTEVGHEEDLRLMIWGSDGLLELVNWRDLYMVEMDSREKIELENTDHNYELIDSFRKLVEGQDAEVVDFEAGYNIVKVVEGILK